MAGPEFSSWTLNLSHSQVPVLEAALEKCKRWLHHDRRHRRPEAECQADPFAVLHHGPSAEVFVMHYSERSQVRFHLRQPPPRPSFVQRAKVALLPYQLLNHRHAEGDGAELREATRQVAGAEETEALDALEATWAVLRPLVEELLAPGLRTAATSKMTKVLVRPPRQYSRDGCILLPGNARAVDGVLRTHRSWIDHCRDCRCRWA
ncbi:unnamed protein product [Symbiodinium microadriaticum]|nr:unnamed protein product [Symbiodinium microadriaticum]